MSPLAHFFFWGGGGQWFSTRCQPLGPDGNGGGGGLPNADSSELPGAFGHECANHLADGKRGGGCVPPIFEPEFASGGGGGKNDDFAAHGTKFRTFSLLEQMENRKFLLAHSALAEV